MSQKQAKKLRQMYSRTLTNEAQKFISQKIQMIKPKPKYIPVPVWRYLVKLVLK